MDNSSFENLRRFFDRVRNAGFFERLFSWQGIVSQGYDAFSEYQQLQAAITARSDEIALLSAKVRDLEKDTEHHKARFLQSQQDLVTEQNRVQALNEKIGENSRALNEKITAREAECARVSTMLKETQANDDATILQLKGDLVALQSKNEELQRQISERENEAGGLQATEKKNRETIEKLSTDVTALTVKNENLASQITTLKQELTQYQQIEEDRMREHDQRITALNSLKDQLDKDRVRLEEERTNEMKEKFALMEQTWRRHEELVEQSLRSICQRHTIEYCDKEKFPVSGRKPDNAVLIADQYVIFDAKSPKNSEELGNFPQYIKTQAEAAKKYARDENVKKDIFLVVPANTIEYLDDVHLDMADYQVYVVTHDSLEPIVLALRKIEDYQFVEQLSPEDREKICHVIGKFAHATKRRMQIDTYFFNEFLGLLKSCETLPEDILKKVVDIEKAEKMNPPMEKRRKLIPIKDLEHDVRVISKEAEAREIDISAVTKEKIETIPLDKYLE